MKVPEISSVPRTKSLGVESSDVESLRELTFVTFGSYDYDQASAVRKFSSFESGKVARGENRRTERIDEIWNAKVTRE